MYFLNGESVTKGVEAESTILVGGGLAVYLNATKGTAKYTDTGLWVQNAPSDTETIGLTYNLGSWNVGFFSKRVGQMYNDNANLHQAIPIDPFNITNLFFNYTVRGSSRLSASRIRLAVNNLTDSHAITAVSAGVGEVQRGRAGRHPDADGRPQRRGVVHDRRQVSRDPRSGRNRRGRMVRRATCALCGLRGSSAVSSGSSASHVDQASTLESKA